MPAGTAAQGFGVRARPTAMLGKGVSMIIDINMHHLPQRSVQRRKDHGWVPELASPANSARCASLGTVESGKKQLILEKPKGYQNLNYVEGDYSLETKLAAMDDAGVDIGILRVPVWQEWLRLDTCKIVNDEAADMCRRSNGRLYATACPPAVGRQGEPVRARAVHQGARAWSASSWPATTASSISTTRPSSPTSRCSTR